MKFSTVVICLAIAMMAALPAMAQQSLGDVAGSIKLKRPEGEPVVIDQSTVGKARPQPHRTEGGLLNNLLDVCITETTALHDLVIEARGGESFYNDPWRVRVEEAGLRLEGALDELALVSVDGRSQEAYGLALRGADLARDANLILRTAIAQNRPVFSEAGTMAKEAAGHFRDAKSALGVVTRAEASEQAAPLINPIEANQNMNALCGGQYGEGSSAFDDCVARQRAAVDTMTSRNPPEVGLDAVSFNVIRNDCRSEWSGNYVNQDRCEQRRMAAKKAQK
jgi:hypothetical protein